MRLDDVSKQFQRFALRECHDAPLYRLLAEHIAESEFVLRIAEQAASEQPLPNHFLAAVHYLVLHEPGAALAGHYALPTEAAKSTVLEAFDDFCRDHTAEIVDIMRIRRVQTNEAARAAVLFPGLRMAANYVTEKPLQVIEVGASAGLLLGWDRYRYRYGTDETFGANDSPLSLNCPNIGKALPAELASPLSVANRVGIDLNPLSPEDPDDVLWLRALVWPDHTHRAKLLTRALELLAQDPPLVMAGDVFAVLPALLEDDQAYGIPCVYHAHTLNQFSPDLRRTFWQLLESYSTTRPVLSLGLEYPFVLGRNREESPLPCLELRVFTGGNLTQRKLLARYEAHGRWIEWV